MLAAAGGQAGPAQGPHGPQGAQRELIFDICDPAFSSDQFRMFEFKIKRCPRARPHDWTQCPFAHPGEKAKRRDPRKVQYSGTACPDFRKGGACPRGDQCPFAHGVFECWLHPSRYRTQMCTDGVNCKRRVCFFAHFDSELRKGEADPVLLGFPAHPDLAAAGGDPRQYPQHPHLGHPLGGMYGHPPQSFELVNGVAVGMPAPLLLPRAPGAHDGSAPCTPTVGGGGGSLTPRASQDSATLLAQLQLIQQQQAAAAAAAAGGTELQRPSSAPASGAGSPAGPASRPVSASASGETLGSSGSPPISPTGVAGAREAAVGTPELAQQLKGPPLSPLGAAAALLQQQCADSASAAAQLAMLGGAGGAGSEALALLLQQQAAAAGLGHHVDQTSLLVALHSLSLGAQPPPPPGGLAAGGGLIRHASDVYQQTRAAAAAAAAAALTPPGHGLVSHRRSMDNSMLAQLQSLQASRSSPGLVGEDSYPMPDLALEAARLSPIAVGPGGDAAAALAALSGAGGPYTPRSPSYISAAPSLSAGLSGAPVSPLAADVTLGGGLGRILTSAPHGDLGSLNLPPTPQTAPAALVRDSWNNKLGSIDEGEPVPMHCMAADDLDLMQRPPGAGMYKTLSDPSALASVLGRNLSFDNILAELPRSSSQVDLSAQQSAAAGGSEASGSGGGGRQG